MEPQFPHLVVMKVNERCKLLSSGPVTQSLFALVSNISWRTLNVWVTSYFLEMKISENARVSNPKFCNRQILENQWLHTKDYLLLMKSLLWGGLSSIQWIGDPSSLHPMMVPSEDLTSKIIEEGKEREGRGTLALMCNHQKWCIVPVHIPVCQNSVKRFQSSGWEMWPGKKMWCGKHSIVSAMMFKEWSNQEIHFRKIILRLYIDSWDKIRIQDAF